MTGKTKITVEGLPGKYSRRQMVVRGALGLAVLAVTEARADAEQAPDPAARTNAISMAKAIHQEEDFKAKPQRIYEALLDSKQFTAFSGLRKAIIDPKVGGAFSLFDGHIIGRNVDLRPDQQIVQAWRVVSWPKGVYSIAKFELEAHDSQTRVIFDHAGFPPDLAEHLANGWQENYWQPLRKYLG